MELTFDLIYASLKGENAALREAYTKQQALILQLVEALESSNVEWKQLADSGDAGFWRAEDQDYYQQSEKAITAGRARLEVFDNATRRTKSEP